jgi:putative ABC transport system permease protein
MLRKKPLQLLKEGSNLKVNFMSKIINKITKPMKFKRRFKYSLMSRSIGKLLIVSITSFFTGMLIVLTIIGLNLFNGMIEKSFANMKYKYMINYAIPVNKIDKNSDVLSVSSMNLKKINSKVYKKSDEKEYTITLDGIDKKTKYVEVMDSEKNNLLDSLYTKENGIVINKNIEGYLKVKVGDILTLDYNGKEYDFVITGVCDEYINESGYVSRSYLNKLMGYDSNSYNVKYTTSEKYSSLSKVNKEERSSISSIFSVDDLKRNINTQMETMNSSIYIVIFFAAIMALIIIGVIANIIVEENKKTISLMKVMGYDNKEISSIVLNIYTPFVIVSYLLSIPVMTNLLKLIMKAIAGDTGMSIPISISPALAMLGLVVLLIAYFVAISISRVVLNKVPLSVALKRE